MTLFPARRAELRAVGDRESHGVVGSCSGKASHGVCEKTVRNGLRRVGEQHPSLRDPLESARDELIPDDVAIEDLALARIEATTPRTGWLRSVRRQRSSGGSGAGCANSG